MTFEAIIAKIQDDLKCSRYMARKHLGRFRLKYKKDFSTIVGISASYNKDKTVEIEYVVMVKQKRKTTI